MTNYPDYNQITAPQPKKETNQFWYRGNEAFLAGVTSAQSNIAFGISQITLNDSSVNQKPYGILANGLLRTVIGTISFQIRLSKAKAPFVQTISTPRGEGADKTYWEHILLVPQVKAQILRNFEAGFASNEQAVVDSGNYQAPPAQQIGQVETPSVVDGANTVTGEVVEESSALMQDELPI